MATQQSSIDDSFRAVTPEEIASYQKFGGAKLKSFIPRAKVDELLAMAKDRMGESGDRDLPPEAFTYFNPLTLRGLKHPVMEPIIEHCGRGARALMARRARVGIRYFTDFVAVKQPAKKKQAGRGGAGGSDWHQDYAASASDRSGGMVFWTALTDMPPEKDTMAFLLVLAEVLQGFGSTRDFNQGKKLLTSLPIINLVGGEIAIQAAKNFRTLRSLGVRKTFAMSPGGMPSRSSPTPTPASFFETQNGFSLSG